MSGPVSGRAWALGFVARLLALASAGSLLAWALGGPRQALGVWGGACLMGADVALMAWLIGRGLRGGQGAALGLIAFVAKLLVLSLTTYYLLGRLGLGVFGFVGGCMSALAALAWHVSSRPS